ncbi:MAG: hypothetical protein FWH06_04555, partial [Oscillospiraceae bacterium]|nr:hypothetical protein [Oscillospiraceae bacterium]
GTSSTVPSSAYTVTPPDADPENKQTVTIAFNSTAPVLETDEAFIINFNVDIRTTVEGEAPGASTLLYYIKNQAVLSYYDAKFYAYTGAAAGGVGINDYIQRNASSDPPSPSLRVDITPILPDRKMSLKDGGPDEPLVDGPFTVDISVGIVEKDPRNISARGLLTILIPEDFELFGEVWEVDAAGNTTELSGEEIIRLPDGTTRINISEVNLSQSDDEYPETRSFRYDVKYRDGGTGYGVAYTYIQADYKCLYTDNEITSPTDLLLEYKRSVAGLSVKTRPDDYVNNGAFKSYDILANDFFSPDDMRDDYGYEIASDIWLYDGDKKRVEATNSAGDYVLTHEDYTVTLDKNSKLLHFDPKLDLEQPFEDDLSYTFYYEIRLTAEKTTGEPSFFDLSSGITAVTVHMVNGDILVYYEEYQDGTFGFAGLPGISLPPLDDEKDIDGWGYGVLSLVGGKTLQLDSADNSASCEEYNDEWYLYKAITGTSDNYTLISVGFIGQDVLGKIHPNFAKAVYEAGASDAGDTFYIRTPEQKANIDLVDDTDKTFVMERGLDDGTTELPRRAAPELMVAALSALPRKKRGITK